MVGLGQMGQYDSLLVWRQAMAQRHDFYYLFLLWEAKLCYIFAYQLNLLIKALK